MNMTNDVQISQKQRDFLSGGFSRINLLEGSVRSGKTWISLVAWAIFVASMPKDAEFLMVGKTLTTLRRNCLGPLQDLEPTFKFNTNAKKAELYGRTIWLEGADNERAENKIRGMTLAGAYVDEITLIPEGFYYMMLSRLSAHGAKLFATTNPDSPSHYVYTDIICNGDIDKKVTKFLISENPFLDPEYVKQLANEYTGVFYQRYFLGEWVIAEGLVYPMFSEENNIVDDEPKSGRYFISVDYGTMNPFSAGLWCMTNDGAVRVNEYYHSGRDSKTQKTDEEYYREIEKLADGYKIEYVIVDPSAASFITTVYRHGKFRVAKANNDVMDGIRKTAVYLQSGKIKVHRRCKDIIREFGLYSWDEDADEDTVIKENDHAMDDLRYFCNTIMVRHFPTQRDYKRNERIGAV